ncbi:hypothetical protein TcasGA2_TC004786 [Tribolium castaneum]|uniref:Uncharacterized protein n=1 Tax=Tribolium castaneum TaxID=7070 RepID=D6W841_TRICA|nr:hypothetical protein TcasGA2_TC004786 [Tribolium castaneum]
MPAPRLVSLLASKAARCVRSRVASGPPQRHHPTAQALSVQLTARGSPLGAADSTQLSARAASNTGGIMAAVQVDRGNLIPREGWTNARDPKPTKTTTVHDDQTDSDSRSQQQRTTHKTIEKRMTENRNNKK